MYLKDVLPTSTCFVLFFEDGHHPFGAQPQKNGGSPEAISGSPPDIKFYMSCEVIIHVHSQGYVGDRYL